MAFRTKLDYSDNRQLTQRERTSTTLSGTTVFGVPFSALTSGPDLSYTAQTSQFFGVVSTYSGNSATTVFTWGIPNVSIVEPYISALTPSNSGVSKNIGAVFAPSSSTVIDGNLVNLTYSGVSAQNFYPITMVEPTPGNYTGTVSTDFFIFSAETLDFTGRTIWIDNTEILRTKKLIISNNPQPGYVLTCVDSEGMVEFQPVSGSSSGTTYWSASTGTNAIVTIFSNSIASGTSSLAEGFLNIAGGDYSHAEGNLTTAIGDASHAEGNQTTSIGLYSHAEGWLGKASGFVSHSEGQNTIASGDLSHAEGNNTIASGNSSHAEGQQTTSVGAYSHSEGLSTTAIGAASHSEGFDTTASGTYSHAEGFDTTASGTYSHAEGFQTVASGSRSHAEGAGTSATTFYAHAEGWNTLASGQYSHAAGINSVASANGSYAQGNGSYAIGTFSHAEGSNTTASGSGSHSEGFNTIASGSTSHAGGGGQNTTSNRVVAGGDGSFIHFTQTVATGIIGAYGDYSAILGGLNHNIYAGADGSAILGGDSHVVSGSVVNSVVIGGSNITAYTSNTVYVPDLVIDGLTSTDPLATDANGKIIAGVSDIRLKKNIVDLPSALDVIKNLRGVAFEYTEESNMGSGIRFGFVAQEVKEIVPELVRIRAKGDGMLNLNYTEIIPWIVEAIKELTNGDTITNELILETQTIAAEDNNIELNYNGTNLTAIGGGISITNGVSDGINAEFKLNSNGDWITNNYIIPSGLVIPNYIPTSSNDSYGELGEITSDDNYLYIKRNNGWKRLPLESF